jgi:cation:H+ antiporter
MWLTVFLFILGFVLVIKGGDYFVDSSVSIAKHFNIPRFLIGTTIVSLATTSPELTVSATASFQGNPGLALGNAVGSVIANTGFIAALVAILVPVHLNPLEFRTPAMMMFVIALLFFALTLDLRLSVGRGCILLIAGLFAIVWDIFRKRSINTNVPGDFSEDPSPGKIRIRPLSTSVLFFLLGLMLIIIGSKCIVDSGVTIASALGVSPMIIGLTIVAVGTSLPELITAVTSVRKGVPDLSIGNIMGANIMNMTLVAGTATIISPLHMTRLAQSYNLPAMLVILFAFIILPLKGYQWSRAKGLFLLLLYVIYLIGIVLSPH